MRYCGSRFQLGLYKTEKEKNAAIGTFNAALETGRAPRFVNAEERNTERGAHCNRADLRRAASAGPPTLPRKRG